MTTLPQVTRLPHRIPSLFCALLGLAGTARSAPEASPEISVIIFAGQSNALNWHADATLLPSDPIDATIPFYHESGAPPDQPGFAVTANVSSHSLWTTLGPQLQDPFVKYHADFFGPEITLARHLNHAKPGHWAVIKVAYFGTNLAADWAPSAQSGNLLYSKLLEHIRTGLAGLRAAGQTPRLAGLFWMQGETDAASPTHAASYRANLTSFIAAVRRNIAAPDLPMVLGRIGPPPGAPYPYQAQVRRAQEDVTDALARVTWVDPDDLPRDHDHIHLLAPGVIVLGQRMALAWENVPTTPNHSK